MIRSILFALALASTCACGWNKAVTEAPSRGFVQRRSIESDGIITVRTPFQYVWHDPGFDDERQAYRERGRYRLFVAPIGTGLLEFDAEHEDMRAEVDKVAGHFHRSLISEIGDMQDSALTVELVATRAEADFALELELTEVGFGSPALYVAAWITPIPGIATAYDAAHTSVLAFEGRSIHVESSRIATEFFDRRIPKVRILDLRKTFSKTSPLRDIVDDWAVELATASGTRLDETDIEGVGSFSLIPW